LEVAVSNDNETRDDDSDLPDRWQRLHRIDYDAIRVSRARLTHSPDAQSLAEELSQSHRRRLRGA